MEEDGKVVVVPGSSFSVLKVLAPAMIRPPEPVVLFHRLPYVLPPPAKVLAVPLVSVILMVELPGVIAAAALQLQTVPVPVTVHVPLPMIAVQLAAMVHKVHVTLNPAASSAPIPMDSSPVDKLSLTTRFD